MREKRMKEKGREYIKRGRHLYKKYRKVKRTEGNEAVFCGDWKFSTWLKMNLIGTVGSYTNKQCNLLLSVPHFLLCIVDNRMHFTGNFGN